MKPVSGAVALGVAAMALLCCVPVPVSARVAPKTAVAAPVPSPVLGRPAGGIVRTASTRPCSSTPFRASPARHRWFRIPAVVQTNDGVLVAFAERRDTIASDLGNFDVVSTRSTDHGCSWSPYTVIGNDGANRVSNPVPILDADTGHLLLFSVITPRPDSGGHGTGLYLQTSSDDGRTFSPLLNDPVRPLGAYKRGLIGPGHGIQLTVTHPGRLIVPMGYRTSAGVYGAYGIYSDDHGATWHTGFDQQDGTGNIKFIEGTIAELPSGDLFISFRDKRDSAKVGTARQYAVSTDGGASLSELFRTLPLKIVSVEGSALALTGPHSGELLFSSPADTTPTLRRDMTIFVSTTGGWSWARRYQVELEDTPGAYSDLVQLDDDSVGVIYETGTVTWKERIAYQTISISGLTHPAQVSARVSYRRPGSAVKASAHAKIMTRVTVAGIASPPGRVAIHYSLDGQARTASVLLTYSNRGVRAITLPKLRPGRYPLTLTYSGTGRIRPLTTSAGTLRVVAG